MRLTGDDRKNGATCEAMDTTTNTFNIDGYDDNSGEDSLEEMMLQKLNVALEKKFTEYLSRPKPDRPVPTVTTVITKFDRFCRAFQRTTKTKIQPETKRTTRADVRLHVYFDDDRDGAAGFILELTKRWTKNNPDPAENT
ncbi:hypothetical protein OEA41_000257 [Lepraria neglecta]|uniref:Uncharacterized protein n=1 Tax=Lepraria neglecta TaxID=209136 RepID=A0AAD9ZFD4_9LECA|nr:hypothetical protein OEA41_000257 [Lepraria neglecta]